MAKNDAWKTHAGDVVLNGKTIHYDTPAYVNSVMSIFQEYKGGGGGAAPAAPAPVAAPAPATPPSAFAPLQNVLGQIGNLTQSSPTDSPGIAGLKTAANVVPSAFHFAGGVLNSLLHPIDTISQIAQHPVQSLIPQGVREGASGLAGYATGDRIGKASDLEAAQRDFTNDPVGTVAPLVLLGRGAAGAVDSATGAAAKAGMADYVANIGDNTAKGVPIPSGVGTDLGGAIDRGISRVARPIVGTGQSVFGKASDVVRGGPAPDTVAIANKILAGGSTDLAKLGAKVLPTIDLTGVKTYSDLSQRLGSAIDTNMAEVDKHFASSPEPVKLTDLTQRSKGIASINYVSEALKNLHELYTKTRDVRAAGQIKSVMDKARTVGLTPSEINMLARKYGTEFGDKAFSKRSGDPLTSVNAQAYENVRTGLKETARSLLKDDSAKVLDKNTSDMIRVKKRADLLREKVNDLEAKIEQRGLLTRAGRAVGGAADVLTGGVVRGFVQKFLLDSNRGNKSFNYKGLEENLNKNIKKMNYLERLNDNTLRGVIGKALRTLNELPESPTRKAGALKAATVFGRPTSVGK
jgi:hypothetical protein